MSEKHDSESIALPNLTSIPVPDGMDRRAFMMRSAVVGAAAVTTGCAPHVPGSGNLGQTEQR